MSSSDDESSSGESTPRERVGFMFGNTTNKLRLVKEEGRRIFDEVRCMLRCISSLASLDPPSLPALSRCIHSSLQRASLPVLGCARGSGYSWRQCGERGGRRSQSALVLLAARYLRVMHACQLDTMSKSPVRRTSIAPVEMTSQHYTRLRLRSWWTVMRSQTRTPMTRAHRPTLLLWSLF